jgi:hypothetical protein
MEDDKKKNENGRRPYFFLKNAAHRHSPPLTAVPTSLPSAHSCACSSCARRAFMSTAQLQLNELNYRTLTPPLGHMRRKNSTRVKGGASGGSSAAQPGVRTPKSASGNFCHNGLNFH